jgi:hypothetical protein
MQGETVPQEGTVYKHPSLRVGYVSQHATHHIGIFILIPWLHWPHAIVRASPGEDPNTVYTVAIPGWS